MLLDREAPLTENSYYEASVSRPPPCPPLEGGTRADVCVVGGGHAGLSAALELAQRGLSVVLLESQTIGWGASGRNGGQLIVGFEGLSAIESQWPAEDVRRAWDISVEGLDLVAQRIREHGIACDHRPGYLMASVSPRKTARLHAWAERAGRDFGYAIAPIAQPDMGSWIASPRFHAGAIDWRGGHLHPLKYCLGLARAAQAAGVRIHERSAVHHVERGPQPVVHTLGEGRVSCRFVVLAGNVYLAEYGDRVAPELSGRIMPVGTYMIATEPMEPARADALIRQRAAVSDTNFVLDYFRVSADHRLLFGSGDSYSGRTPRRMAEGVRRKMLQVFPQLADLQAAHAWGGFVDLTLNRAPDFGRLGDNVYYLQGFSGHGLALTGVAGRLVAEAITGQAGRLDLFSRIHHLPFPGGSRMRTPALVLGMLFFRLRDLL